MNLNFIDLSTILQLITIRISNYKRSTASSTYKAWSINASWSK